MRFNGTVLQFAVLIFRVLTFRLEFSEQRLLHEDKVDFEPYADAVLNVKRV